MKYIDSFKQIYICTDDKLVLELKSTMFLIGAKNIRELKSVEYITTEPLTSWISKVRK